MKREERLNFIAKLISENEIETQEDLAARLLEHNIEVTQATISRDINSLALVKVPSSSGGYRYHLPKKRNIVDESFSDDLFFESITSVKRSDNMLNISTLPGTTSLVKTNLLEGYEEQLFCVIIDDDTVLAIFNTEESAKIVCRLLQSL